MNFTSTTKSLSDPVLSSPTLLEWSETSHWAVARGLVPSVILVIPLWSYTFFLPGVMLLQHQWRWSPLPYPNFHPSPLLRLWSPAEPVGGTWWPSANLPSANSIPDLKRSAFAQREAHVPLAYPRGLPVFQIRNPVSGVTLSHRWTHPSQHHPGLLTLENRRKNSPSISWQAQVIPHNESHTYKNVNLCEMGRCYSQSLSAFNSG